MSRNRQTPHAVTPRPLWPGCPRRPPPTEHPAAMTAQQRPGPHHRVTQHDREMAVLAASHGSPWEIPIFCHLDGRRPAPHGAHAQACWRKAEHVRAPPRYGEGLERFHPRHAQAPSLASDKFGHRSGGSGSSGVSAVANRLTSRWPTSADIVVAHHPGDELGTRQRRHEATGQPDSDPRQGEQAAARTDALRATVLLGHDTTPAAA